jgi:hypothetical protein
VSDSGVEIYNLLRQEGITNVAIMGVHTNMCVLGRPFGIRQLTRLGLNVVLVRDLVPPQRQPLLLRRLMRPHDSRQRVPVGEVRATHAFLMIDSWGLVPSAPPESPYKGQGVVEGRGSGVSAAD